MKNLLSFKGILILVVLVSLSVFFFACEKEEVAAEPEPAAEEKPMLDEEYVAVLALSSYPMFVNNDYVGLEQFGEEYGVTTTIAGPTEWDMDAFAQTVGEVAARKPAGMIVYGFSPVLKNAIDSAMDAGIPVVCVDADVSDSKRLAFVGTDWDDVGRTHAREMVRLTGGKGQVAVIMIINIDIMQDALRGYEDVLSDHPEMELVGVFDDSAGLDATAQITTDLLTAYPDLAGISGFDGYSAGIGAALKESDRAGDIMVTAQDTEPAQVKHLEDGVFHVLVGQKRALFSYYGAKILYDYNHSQVTITPNDEGAKVTNIPMSINTGLFTVTPETVADFKGDS